MRRSSIWMAAALAAASWTGGGLARPWPDSSAKIVVFADQFPEGMTTAQRQFAAANIAGTQKMRLSEIQAIRAYNANFLCLHYQLALGCGNHQFIVGDEWTTDWPFVNGHETWFLHNPSAQRVHQTAWNWDMMDITYSGNVANTPFPEYWITSCLARIRSADNDGCFADSFTADSYVFGACNPTHPWFEDIGQCIANWIPSLMTYGQAIRAAFDTDGASFKFIPNMGALVTGWDPSNYGLGHGMMIEGFGFWGTGDYFELADWQLQMDRGLAQARSNKIVICQSYPSLGSYSERMFLTASYLLIKCSRTYFTMLTSDLLEFFPEYKIDLGAAQTAAPASIASLYHAPWGVYRRLYAGGMALVNPGNSPVNIPNLGGTYYRVSATGGGAVDESGSYGGSLSYQAVTSLSLPAYSGAVLTTSPGGGLWADAEDRGGGWKSLPWFGYFNDPGTGWIYHNEHGWMYCIGETTASIWFWTSDLGWLWSSSSAYPSLYRAIADAWLWYQIGSHTPRWFYNYGTATWEAHYPPD